MKIEVLKKISAFLQEENCAGAYGIMVKNLDNGTAEVTHMLFPKFFPHVSPHMTAEEVGRHPVYQQALVNAKYEGIEFDTSDSRGTFTGYARLTHNLPFRLSDDEALLVRQTKGHNGLLKLIEILENKAHQTEAPR